MNRRAWIAALLLGLTATEWGLGGEPSGCAPDRPCFLQRIGPVGGWFPYGGGLLHWWDPHCFPRCGGPDDYDRKHLPAVCWPPYPPYYIWGSPHGDTPTPPVDASEAGPAATPTDSSPGAGNRP